MADDAEREAAIRAELPDRERIKVYIEESDRPLNKRDIAKAFGLKGAQRAALRDLLREMAEDGLIDQGHKKKVAAKGALPEVMVLTVYRLDGDGEPWAKPQNWDEEEDGAPPQIVVCQGQRGGPAPKLGDRILAKLRRYGQDRYEARVIRILAPGPRRLLGVLEPAKGGALLVPTDKKNDHLWFVSRDDLKGAEPGDLVLADPLRGSDPVRGGARSGPRNAKVAEVVGRIDAPKAFSLISIHSYGIPVEFPAEAEAQAESAQPAPLHGRIDLRDIPLITIDGEDARDFDDAVFAEPDDAPDNKGGHKILVAIADVAYYVTPESALDRTARERGNSVYFPDRVVPMLPEGLSNDLCSLRPHEDRACMAIRMTISAEGQLRSKKVLRATMRSHARLTYTRVQQAMDGAPDNETAPLVEPVLKPLYEAYACLERARKSRGTLELDIPELQVFLGQDGQIEKIAPRSRMDSHKLIEEFMIAANVAAAALLEARNAQAIMYRIHEPPSLDKLESLKESLAAMDIKLAGDGVLKPSHFKRILAQAAGTERAQLVSDMILRCQSQAVYSPDNEGHFGLALQRYCHFTSPIRRYADLLVHRALISSYGLGDGGLPDAQAHQFEKIGEIVSTTERRASAAERDATDRYLAVYMAERIGASFPAKITGVKRFGLFVKLDETGADGLVPVSTLPWDRYWHDDVHQRLIGEETGLAFQLASAVRVKLVEANTVTGGLIFEMSDGGHVIKDFKARRPGGGGRRGAGWKGAGRKGVGRKGAGNMSKRKGGSGKSRKPRR